MSGVMDESINIVEDLVEGAINVAGICVASVITSGIAVGAFAFDAAKATAAIGYEAAKTVAVVGYETAKFTGKVAIGTAKVTAKVGLETGKFVGVTALGAAYGMGLGAVESVTGIKDGIKELQTIALEEKRQLDKAQLVLFEHLNAHEAEKDKYIKDAIPALRLSELKLKPEVIYSAIKSAKMDELSGLNVLSYTSFMYHKFSETLVMLSDIDIPTDVVEQSFYETIEQVKAAIKNHNLDQLVSINQVLNQSIENLKSIYDAYKKEHKVVVEKLDGIFFMIENGLDLPLHTRFENELSYFLNNTFKNDLQEAKLSTILDLKKQILSMYMDISNLSNGKDFDDLIKLIDSVHIILNDEALSVDTKIDMLQVRLKVLSHQYQDITKLHEETIIHKRSYDALYQKDSAYRLFLGIEPPVYAFNMMKPLESIKQLESDLNSLEKEVQVKREQIAFRRAIHDVMKDMQYAHITDADEMIGDQSVYKDIYHIENGNVVTVSIFPNGELNYRVSAVETPGIPTDKADVVKTMHTFCHKAEDIREKLRKKGIMTTNNERLEPHIRYVNEIKLDSSVDIRKKEIIRKAKLGDIKYESLKKRAIR